MLGAGTFAFNLLEDKSAGGVEILRLGAVFLTAIVLLAAALMG